MRSKTITIKGVTITAHDDGSIEKPFHGRTRRSFGSNNGHGYKVVGINHSTFMVHRIIAMAFLADFSSSLQVDHIDGNKINNVPNNLRMVTIVQNLRGFRVKSKGTSQYRGVWWNNQSSKWASAIKIDGRTKHIGLFDCEHTAALAWNKEAHLTGYAPEALNTFK